jgi:CRP-like cAMP-binding protein
MSILPSTLRPFASLKSLPDPALVALSKVLRGAQFRTGAQICREGDSGDTCYFLIEGSVEVTTQLADGRRIFLATLGPGTLFGRGGLVHGRLARADVRASCNVHVLTLRRLDYQWALDRGIPWAVHLQKLVCVHVIRQLRSAIRHLRELADGASPSLEHTPSSDQVGRGETVDESDSEPRPAGPPLPEGHDATTTGRLLTLIAETEATLAGEGVDLGSVQFVVDMDAERRTYRRSD